MTVDSTSEHSPSSSPILDHTEQCTSDTSSTPTELNRSDDTADQQQDVAVLLNSLLNQIDSMEMTFSTDEQPIRSMETISDSKAPTRTLRSHVRKRIHTPVSEHCRQEFHRRRIHTEKRRIEPSNHQSTADVLGNLKPRPFRSLFIRDFQMKNPFRRMPQMCHLIRRPSKKRIDLINSRSIHYHRTNVGCVNNLLPSSMLRSRRNSGAIEPNAICQWTASNNIWGFVNRLVWAESMMFSLTCGLCHR